MQLLRGGWLFASSLPAYGVLALAGLLSWIPLRRFDIPRRAILPVGTTCAFFGYMAIRTLLSPVPYIARPDLFIIIAAPILYLLIAFYVTSPRLRTYLIAILLLLGFANGIVGAVQYFMGENFMVFSALPRANYGTRASGFFGNPNQLAGFLEIALLLGTGLAWWGRLKLWGRIVAGYGALMCAAGLVLSVSRGGYASTVAGLFVFGLLSLTVATRKTRGNFWILTLAFIVLASGLAFTVLSVMKSSDVVQSRVSATATDVPFRASLWKAALLQFQLSPIVGTGSATYLYYGRLFRDPVVQTDPTYAHNDYLQLLAEFGLIGFAGFLVFLVAHLRAGWLSLTELTRHLRSSRLTGGSNSLALTVGALSSVAAYMIHSAVDFNLHIPANALVMALVFGLLANPGSIPASTKTGEHAPTFTLPVPVRFVAPFLGACLLIAGVPLVPATYYTYRTERILSDWKYMENPELAREAEKFARLALERDPKNPDLYRSLGETQFALANLSSHLPEVQNRYLSESVEIYRKALELAPMDRNLVLAVAWSLDDMRRFSESDPLFQRALELDPQSYQVRASYAGHLELEGKLAEAIEEYKRARDLGSYSAILALERIAEASRKSRTGAENDAPKIGR